MKVYFTASIVGKKQYLHNYLKIIKILLDKNHQVLSDHIVKSTEEEIRLEKREDRMKFHDNLEKWIGGCDFMVVEASFPSISVGYEISLALQFNKTVLILYSEGDPPSLLVHHSSEKVICEKYSLTTLQDIIEDFINYAQGSADSRFTFYITSEIASYLEKVSRKKKLPKSVYLRHLIQSDMEKHA
ncbi:hypothetical protein A2334_01500 [Candidatus Roizmanbacteria bacterium RIFOXYB2_FULL_38_10]|uniref:2'-deoxynucleoside 5'-phosphate N-hydrolase 1 n=1 Tax=Candidatus Roizmanbacteria bacterium RIFOXYD1_FULL_38_12 TaxID=1802093 RepID=A0A1F7L251_9BACT|nr:MAG: hypothetical protein A3K47_05560 [Candidatus Roizmanbacteria bacterium RIFOXYA2_FULL_38_14]OGK64210.1 MAG: hypothetical protein A3K27_05560 [Candidatus Roizmanbacteria bacterium RIFOXYA1_FULL_37_12]OGK66056.1 MAG: hypothetical protein A3K38_05560 [Candidatus Roizmanbacteria bacterium RIFOXYB1_FULL_40_23]OGK68525.1 MAG: hypothetical protein A2334_01500 [Candidatus Roizmanbacteria bacterium RIFOXYB2_FULL_38_10]OGK70461.1 MAG: hypothetical protein A3K21_05565 [Candidatus Roizmanbacteria ba